MIFELVTGSNHHLMTTVRIDQHNSTTNVWWCEGKQEWHWCLIWEDGTNCGTHMHNGIAPTEEQARADITKTIIYIEDFWPRPEYFENNW
jgi:hypothetical protein